MERAEVVERLIRQNQKILGLGQFHNGDVDKKHIVVEVKL